jgi:hypothetical protein
MGGMGRIFDGGYGEYTSVPTNQVQAIKTKISWDQLGALPEMMQYGKFPQFFSRVYFTELTFAKNRMGIAL